MSPSGHSNLSVTSIRQSPPLSRSLDLQALPEDPHSVVNRSHTTHYSMYPYSTRFKATCTSEEEVSHNFGRRRHRWMGVPWKGGVMIALNHHSVTSHLENWSGWMNSLLGAVWESSWEIGMKGLSKNHKFHLQSLMSYSSAPSLYSLRPSLTFSGTNKPFLLSYRCVRGLSVSHKNFALSPALPSMARPQRSPDRHSLQKNTLQTCKLQPVLIRLMQTASTPSRVEV